jgi:hypothetical protein
LLQQSLNFVQSIETRDPVSLRLRHIGERQKQLAARPQNFRQVVERRSRVRKILENVKAECSVKLLSQSNG